MMRLFENEVFAREYADRYCDVQQRHRSFHIENWQHFYGQLTKTPQMWLPIDGSPEQPLAQPSSNSRHVIVLQVDTAQMRAAREKYIEARDAILLRFGSKLVLGKMHLGEGFSDRFERHIPRGSQSALNAAIGIQGVEHEVLAGVYAPTLRQFEPVTTLRGLPIPRATVPEGIPILS